eukprot:2287842-Pyramimonas_sp.AAC.1
MEGPPEALQMASRRPKRFPRGPQEARLWHAPVLDSAVQDPQAARPWPGLEPERARSARDGSSICARPKCKPPADGMGVYVSVPSPSLL